MTTPIEFTSKMTVELIQSVGSDSVIADAARVSTGGVIGSIGKVPDDPKDAGLINYLMKHSHGSPFEHNSFTFRVEAPIFVAREFMRHRIGFSFNEVSARYTKLEPKFYVYSFEMDRAIVQAGSSAHPVLAGGTFDQWDVLMVCTREAYSDAWDRYEWMLAAGIANEVARAVLPVGIFTSFYVTCNARSLMSFLKLRVDSPDNTYETKPQWEIEQVAIKMEDYLHDLFPATYAAFVKNGRVAP